MFEPCFRFLAPLLRFLGAVNGVPSFKSLFAEFAEKVPIGLADGRDEDWKVASLEVEIDVDAVGDLLRALHGVRSPLESGVHLLGRLQVKLARAVLHPLRIAHHLAGVDAEQDLMGFGVVGTQIVRVASGDERQADLLGDLDGCGGAPFLNLESVVLNLHVKAVAESLGEPLGETRRLVHAVVEDERAHFAGGAAGQDDEPFSVGFEEFLVDARAVVETFEERRRRHLDEILDADAVLREHREVETRFVAEVAANGAVGTCAGGDVSLVTDDGIEAVLLALLVELDGAEQVSVVRDRQRVHAELFGLLDERGDFPGAIEQAVVRMAMKMDERTTHGFLSS